MVLKAAPVSNDFNITYTCTLTIRLLYVYFKFNYYRIDQERRTREAQEDAIVRRMNEELAKVVEALAIEQQTREDSEAALVQVLEDAAAFMARLLRKSRGAVFWRLLGARTPFGRG